MNPFFRSKGKLLISGEYAVLKGATAFALPLVLGGSLEVIRNDSAANQFEWVTEVKGDEVFRATVDCQGYVTRMSEEITGHALQQILRALLRLAGDDFFRNERMAALRSGLDFPMTWGLGSSSTLINNLAQWANIDAFELSDLTFGGSGYDIACAGASLPILFQRKEGRCTWRELSLGYPFNDRLFFVYLNRKMNSRQAMASFAGREHYLTEQMITRISAISEALTAVREVNGFCDLLEEHESMLSAVLGVEPLKQQFFRDFPGTVKSLGAWGGDFALAVGRDAKAYFHDLGYPTVLTFEELTGIKKA